MDSPELHQGPFDGPDAFADLVRQAIAQAQQQGWAEMVWSDPGFADWPLYERAVVEALHAWAGKGRRLILLAHHFDAMRRVQHRFVDWRVRWNHIVECYQCKTVAADDFPSALWTPTWALHRRNLPRCTGVASMEPRMRLQLREALEACRRQGSPGFPANTLGL